MCEQDNDTILVYLESTPLAPCCGCLGRGVELSDEAVFFVFYSVTISVGTEFVVDHWYLDRSCVWLCNLNCGGTPQGGSRSIGNFDKNPSVGTVGSTPTKCCYSIS